MSMTRMTSQEMGLNLRSLTRPLANYSVHIPDRLSAIAVFLAVLPFTCPVPPCQAQTDSQIPQLAQFRLNSTIVQSLPSPKMTPEALLEALFTAETIPSEWFDATFLTHVSVAQVQSIVTGLKADLGTFQRVQSEGQDYLIVLERGMIPAKLVLNGEGKVIGLLFQAPRLTAKNLDEVIEQFKQLPGEVSVLVLENGKPRASLKAGQPMAVGSTFKLAVLKALRSQIESGQKSWRDVVALRPEWKSLPSGFLQTWPDGSLLTLESLAALMISQSDNTATDHLVHSVGREAVEAIAPRNRPFLTTRELFILKSQPDLTKQYRGATEQEQRSLLNSIANNPLPTAKDFFASPIQLDVEWFFTTSELCELMSQVQDLPLMNINPGVAKPEDWQRVAFKGGSEPGVLNLTTWLQGKNNQQFCVSASWNHTTALDETKFNTLYNTLLSVLKP